MMTTLRAKFTVLQMTLQGTMLEEKWIFREDNLFYFLKWVLTNRVKCFYGQRLHGSGNVFCIDSLEYCPSVVRLGSFLWQVTALCPSPMSPVQHPGAVLPIFVDFD